MTLDVLISTCRSDGIDRVAAMDLPVVDGVRYIVTWQLSGTTPIPAWIEERKDIEVYRVDSVGLSNNRNEGIARSRADIYLVADDDLRYTPGGLLKVIEVFGSRPSMDIALLRFDGPDRKVYPPKECPLFPYPKFYYPTSFEIAVRRSDRTACLRFDPRFGLGSSLFHAGEEDIFLLSGRKLGLDMRLLPYTITVHEHKTTGERHIDDDKVLSAFGAVMPHHYPFTFPLRICLKAWRLSSAGQSGFVRSLVRMTGGALYTVSQFLLPWRR